MRFHVPPRKRRIVLGGLGVALIALAVVASLLWARWRAVPEYWKSYARYLTLTPPEQLDAIAHEVEVRLLPAWSAPVKPGGDGVRTISASFEEINAWLAAKLDRYLRNQGVSRPDGLEAVMVTQRDGQLVVAASVDLPKFQQIVSVYLEFPRRETRPETVDLKVARIVGGRLTLPGQVLVDRVREMANIDDPGVDAVLEAVARDQALPMPLLPIDRTREAEVLAVMVRPDGVEVTVRVRPRSESAEPTSGPPAPSQ